MQKLFEKHNISFSVDEPMCKHTSFQIGGPADLFVCPTNKEQ
ncbi:MAG: UDP-N-acetylenolpyruvoylglucosamine reductase, partial [Ruminococcaceae bacterium]|nr:UDP-N-acetylenolpyruvoylglucosamine reductase [Oscillospiraceae bacterium]